MIVNAMIKVVPVRGGFEDKMRKLVNTNDVAKVGWFSEDGKHPTADMTYPELAIYHATGSEGVPIRDVLQVAKVFFKPEKYKVIRAAIVKYVVTGTEEAHKDVIKALGAAFWVECHDTIGTSRLHVESNPTPLVDTSELKDHLSYRTSKDPTLKR